MSGVPMTFGTVLIASRGEIAVRIMRTLRRLGIRAAAVYSDADATACHVLEADVAVRIGPAAAERSYLDVGAVLAAAAAVGADAVHPGYGFLAENAGFAQACADAGLVFIGPPPAAIRAMGDKISAKRLVSAAGVPVVPGAGEPGMSDAQLATVAREVGFPVLLKPSAGGGGKGMRRVDDAASLAAEVAAARREAMGAFGDDALLVERFVERPRHVEIQVLADTAGNVIHLGERECSLQRRHQKVVEEAPSPFLPPEARAAMGAAAVATARACGYVGAGTVEFVVPADRPTEFYFLEMNTRLQVEHAVTELVTGLDLVEQQLRCAAGEPLGLAQEQVTITGHAVEARVYAEDPTRDFLPTGGRVLHVAEPAEPHVRIDSGISAGTVIGPHYDPMLAKVVAWGDDRATALRRLDRALAGTTVLGVTTNVAFLRALLADEDVAAGRLDTGLIARRLTSLLERGLIADHGADDVAAAALARLAARRAAAGSDPFDTLTGWRVTGPAWTRELLQPVHPAGAVTEAAVRGTPDAAQVRVGDGDAVPAAVRLAGTRLLVTTGATTREWACVVVADDVWLGRDGATWHLRAVPPAPRAGRDAAAGGGPLVAPMPGTVIALHVKVGDAVEPGQPVAVVEAMKMEHVVRATTAGVVTEVLVDVGQTVPLEAPLALVEGS